MPHLSVEKKSQKLFHWDALRSEEVAAFTVFFAREASPHLNISYPVFHIPEPQIT